MTTETKPAADRESATLNERVTWTNRGCAWVRSLFTDIPFAQEIYSVMVDRGEGASTENIDGLTKAGIIPYFEARYKLTNRFLEKSGVTQVLEVASGMSPRGLDLALQDYTYVEMDLPSESLIKKQVIEGVCRRKNIASPGKLFFEGGNAIDKDDFLRACSHFDKTKPVVVICEGFLRYVSFDGKDLFFGNVRDLLSETDGMMVTPDIELLSDNPNGDASHERMKEQTGIDIRKNLFKDMHHALSYCYARGFEAKHHSPTGVMQNLASPKKLNISNEEVYAKLATRHAFVLTLIKSKALPGRELL